MLTREFLGASNCCYTGKTAAARMASQVMGSGARLVSYAGERFLPPPKRQCRHYPPFWMAESLLTRYFNGGGDLTCSASTEPRTCPLITANWFNLDKLEGNSRYVLFMDKIRACPEMVLTLLNTYLKKFNKFNTSFIQFGIDPKGMFQKTPFLKFEQNRMLDIANGGK